MAKVVGTFQEDGDASALRKQRQEAYRLSLLEQSKEQADQAAFSGPYSRADRGTWPEAVDDGLAKREKQEAYRQSISKISPRHESARGPSLAAADSFYEGDRRLQATKSGRLVQPADERHARQKKYLEELTQNQTKAIKRDDSFYLPPPGPILEDPNELLQENGGISERFSHSPMVDRKQRYLSELRGESAGHRRVSWGGDRSSLPEAFAWGTSAVHGPWSSPAGRELLATQSLQDPFALSNVNVFQRGDHEAVMEVRREVDAYLKSLRETFGILQKAQERNTTTHRDVILKVGNVRSMLVESDKEVEESHSRLQQKLVDGEKQIFDVESKELTTLPHHNRQRLGAREDWGDPFVHQLYSKLGAQVSQAEQAAEERQVQVLREQEKEMMEDFKKWQKKADETLDDLLEEAFSVRVIEDKELELLEKSIRSIEELEAHDIHEQLFEQVDDALEAKLSTIKERVLGEMDPAFSDTLLRSREKVNQDMDHINKSFLQTQKTGFGGIVDLASDLEMFHKNVSAIEDALDSLLADFGTAPTEENLAKEAKVVEEEVDELAILKSSREKTNEFLHRLIAKNFTPRSGMRNASLLAMLQGYDVHEIADSEALESRKAMQRLYHPAENASCGGLLLESAELAMGGQMLNSSNRHAQLIHPSPESSFAAGAGLHSSVATLPTTFTVYTASADGIPLLTGAANIHVEVLQEDEQTEALEVVAQLPAREKGDGTYMIQSIYENTGAYKIAISLGKTELHSGPFEHHVYSTFEGVKLFTKGQLQMAINGDYYDKELLVRATRYPTLGSVDLQLIVDNTASMSQDMESIAEYAREMIAIVKCSPLCLSLKVGVILYRDHWPEDDSPDALHALPLTDNYEAVADFIKNASPGGGGDFPEALGDALALAARPSTWRPYSAKLAVVIGDAPPHGFQVLSDPEVQKQSKLLDQLKQGAHAAAKLLETSKSETVLAQAEKDLRTFLGEIDERMRYYDSFPKGDPTGAKWYEQCELLRQAGIPLVCIALRDAVSHTPTRNSFLAMAQSTGGCYYPIPEGGDFSFLPPLMAMFVDEGLDKRLLEEEVTDCAISHSETLSQLPASKRSDWLLSALHSQRRFPLRINFSQEDSKLSLGLNESNVEHINEAIQGVTRVTRALMIELRSAYSDVGQWLETVHALSTVKNDSMGRLEERMGHSAFDLRYIVAHRVLFSSDEVD